MRRREVIAILASAVAIYLAGAPEASAQNKPRIGIIVLGNPDPAPFFKAFREGLSERGYVEGRTVTLEIRSADGDLNRLAEAAEELVRLSVDIIVAWQTPAATAAKQATQSIPIVMAAVGDPVGTGLIDSLGRPGGNITGIAGFGAELSGKNLELIRELMPAGAPRRRAAERTRTPSASHCASRWSLRPPRWAWRCMSSSRAAATISRGPSPNSSAKASMSCWRSQACRNSARSRLAMLRRLRRRLGQQGLR